MGPTNIYRIRAVSADSEINRKYPERFYVGFLAANAARDAMLEKMVADDDWYTMRGVKPPRGNLTDAICVLSFPRRATG